MAAIQEPPATFIITIRQRGRAAVSEIVAHREESGRPISRFGATITAIARSRNAAVAARNTWDFEMCGIRVVDPWSA